MSKIAMSMHRKSNVKVQNTYGNKCNLLQHARYVIQHARHNMQERDSFVS